LGWKLINIWIGKHILSLCYPNWTQRAMWLDVWSHYSTIETLTMVYCVYFDSAMMYEIIFWGNSIGSNKVFLQHKRTVRTILGINPWSTCKPHFKTLGILKMPSQYILSLMEFFINNLVYFYLNSEIHNKFTRNKTCLYVPQVCIKVFNSLPKCKAD
jgi:hypothetical protein